MKKVIILFVFFLIIYFLHLVSVPLGPTSVFAQAPSVTSTPDPRDWYMSGANPKRTSWVSDDVMGNLNPDWSRAIEAYIPQNVQIVAVNNILYVSTGRGLYALRADTGATVWRYDTEVPMGNSPTVVNGTAYVGSYDKRIHAIDATTGTKKWVFQAKAGFNVNPLVVGGLVLAGSRDGYFYAIDASSGQLAWQYPAAGQPALGPIMYSAAYDNGVVYFASNDNFAYALNVNTGLLVWKSPQKMPGESFQSWWPVIYTDNAPGGTGKDFVIFSGSSGYRTVMNPGINATGCDDLTNGFMRRAIFGVASGCTNSNSDISIGPISTSISGPWPTGARVMDGQKIIDYYENTPQTRTVIYLNKSDGTEYTFDSDGDGKIEYAPILHYGTKNGNVYPPIIHPATNGYKGDTVLHFNWENSANGWIAQGSLMGWKVGTKYMSIAGLGGAVDEPRAVSGGGSTFFVSLCCDRAGDSTNGDGLWQNWNSSALHSVFPGYDKMWNVRTNAPNDRMYTAGYKGTVTTINDVYNNHGDQNPIIPHRGRVFTHRGNSIIAYRNAATPHINPPLGQSDLLVTPVTDIIALPSNAELSGRLDQEVLKIIAAGVSLKPGYHNEGMLPDGSISEVFQYFQNPGEMLATLSRAYPKLSPSTQSSLQTYLASYVTAYFNPTTYASIGWNGANRNYMDYPPEVSAAMTSGKSQGFPVFNHYALWQYAKNVPGVNIATIYNISKSKISTSPQTSDPWNHNQWIAGYNGFLGLYSLAGSPSADATLKNNVQSSLNTILASRANNFTKDNPWESLTQGGDFRPRRLSVARNFMYLTPELGDYLRQNANAKVTAAFTEYDTVAPYWFATSFEGTSLEGVIDILHEQWLFQAKAYLYKGTPQGSKESLYKYLDTPYFKIGDLFYMNNLIDVIEAASDGSVPTQPPASPTPTPKPGDVDGNGSITLTDLSTLLSNFGKNSMQRNQGDLTGDGSVNLTDLSQLLSNFGK